MDSDAQRREFLRSCGCALATLAIAPLLTGCEVSKVVEGSGTHSTKKIQVDVSGLTRDGDGLVTTELASDSKPVIVIRRSDGEFTSLSSLCPHSGRTVGKPINGAMECPGHNSFFNLDGTAKSGIAVQFGNLRVYANSYDANRRILTVSA